MLEDRDYMRQPSFESRRSVTVILIIVNVAAFILQSASYLKFPAASAHAPLPTDHLFALSLDGLKQDHYFWQLITFQFMHGGIVHLLLNCWMLYVFGRAVEEVLGARNLLVLYLTSGVLGGLLQMLGELILERILPDHVGGAVVGASAGVFGLVAAFATLYPERPLTLLLLFIIPVNMRAKYLLLGSALLAVYGTVFPFGGIAHAAHLGGMFMGIAYVRQIVHWQWNWLNFRRPPRRVPPREMVRVNAGEASVWLRRPTATPEELPPAEFISKEVDPILDKISAHGIHSLTERERKTLEAARKKMEKR